nr:hydroxymethylglutaryl-CoA lyase [Tianweitania sediminis]
MTEVASRDGLQNEAHPVSTEQKIELIDRVARAGIRRFEVTSFVSPRAVPALSDAEDVVRGVRDRDRLVLEALVPNLRGAERAAPLGLDAWVCFVSASETHSLANSNAPTYEAIERLRPVIGLADQLGIEAIGSIATAFGCPFEGDVPIGRVVDVAHRQADLGFRTIKLGDTIGSAHPSQVTRMLAALNQALPQVEFVLHLHDTRGMSLANVLAGLAAGGTAFESSLGGVGGCPFAPGATGNVSTEDLVHFLHLEGHETGADLAALIEAGRWLETVLGRPLPARLLHSSPVGTLVDPTTMKRAVG